MMFFYLTVSKYLSSGSIFSLAKPTAFRNKAGFVVVPSSTLLMKVLRVIGPILTKYYQGFIRKKSSFIKIYLDSENMITKTRSSVIHNFHLFLQRKVLSSYDVNTKTVGICAPAVIKAE